MKRLFNILLILITNTLLAQSADSLFVDANKLYQQEKYAEALSFYEQISNSKLESDDLYYNMANAYYKTNQVAPAVYYYEKALLLNPNHTDAIHNLRFAKRMGIDNIEALPKTLGQKFSENIIQKFSYNTWAYFAVACSFLFALLFLLYHFSYGSGNKRFYFISSIISALFIMLAVVFSYANYEYVKNYKTAIVFAQQTAVKSAPTASGEISFELHEGTKIQLLESLDGYKKIKIADGKIGWIAEDAIKELQ
jgi:tetratricopeptide (TPR) repeat protein